MLTGPSYRLSSGYFDTGRPPPSKGSLPFQMIPGGKAIGQAQEAASPRRLGLLRWLDNESSAPASERARLVVEPSGAAGVAALLSGRIPLESGERVVALLSGGNVGVDHIAEWLAG